MLVITIAAMLLRPLLVASIVALYPYSGVLFPPRPGHSEVVAEVVWLIQVERVAEAFPPGHLLCLEAVG